jgi:hypothetical protein
VGRGSRRVDHIDTAQYYGVVNDLIREALYP